MCRLFFTAFFAFTCFPNVRGQPNNRAALPLAINCNPPSTFSLTVATTSEGAEVSFKLSSSPNARTVLFRGHNVSSPLICGENYQKCSAFSVVTPDGVTLVVLPLGQAVGLLTFNGENASAFQDDHVIDISGRGFNCEFSVFYVRQDPNNHQVEFFGLCRNPAAASNILNLYDIQFIIDSVNLSGTNVVDPNPFCIALEPSRLIYFSAPESVFTDGLVVFVDSILDQRQVYFGESGSGQCDTFSNPFPCSEVQRFVGVPVMTVGGLGEEEKQAVYCPNVTYLIDVVQDESDSITREFSHDEDGYPIFCSVSIICIFFNGQFILQYANGSAVLPPVDFLYDGVLTQGDCSIASGQHIVVLHLGDNSVLAVNLNRGVTTLLGVSVTPPLVFGENVLLSNSTHARVHNLLDAEFEDTLEQDNLVLGLVLSGPEVPRACPTSKPTSTPSPTPTLSTTPTSSLVIVSSQSPTPSPGPAQERRNVVAGVVVAGVVAAAVIVLIIIIFICYWTKCRTKTNNRISLALPLSLPNPADQSTDNDSKSSNPANGVSNNNTTIVDSVLDSPPDPSPAASSPATSTAPSSTAPSFTSASPSLTAATCRPTTTSVATTTTIIFATTANLPVAPEPNAPKQVSEHDSRRPVFVSGPHPMQRPNEGGQERSDLGPGSPTHNPTPSFSPPAATHPSILTLDMSNPHEGGSNGRPVQAENCNGSRQAAQLVVNTPNTLMPPPGPGPTSTAYVPPPGPGPTSTAYVPDADSPPPPFDADADIPPPPFDLNEDEVLPDGDKHV